MHRTVNGKLLGPRTIVEVGVTDGSQMGPCCGVTAALMDGLPEVFVVLEAALESLEAMAYQLRDDTSLQVSF
jgi:hypothetical protein